MLDKIKSIVGVGADPQVQLEQRHMKAQQELNMNDALAKGFDDAAYLQRMQQEHNLVRWQQDFQEDIERVKHFLRCEYYDSEKGKWLPQTIIKGKEKDENGEEYFIRERVIPMLNEAGIAQVEATLAPFVSRDMLNSNYNEDEVWVTALIKSNNLVASITAHHEYFGLRYYTDVFTINDIVTVFMQASLKSALNDGWRRHIRSHTKELRSFSASDSFQPQKKGVFGLGA